MSYQLTPLTHHETGAEVRGVDLTQPVDDAMRKQLNADFARYHVLAIRDQIAPGTMNLDEPGEGCDLDFIPNRARPMKIDIALSNSFGFGGTNGCLIFKRYAE